MWSHLFSGVISDEVVELLVVYTFVKSTPNGPPSSRVTGFPRSSLERCALYGMMQQGAVASWVLLFEVLHMLQK
jgi:hypothetical protein